MRTHNEEASRGKEVQNQWQTYLRFAGQAGVRGTGPAVLAEVAAAAAFVARELRFSPLIISSASSSSNLLLPPNID